MNGKDYQLIADTLKASPVRQDIAWSLVVLGLADALGLESSVRGGSFDRDAFLSRCGYVGPVDPKPTDGGRVADPRRVSGRDVGSTVRVRADAALRPQYILGKPVTLRGFYTKRASVDVPDDPSYGRFAGKTDVRVPIDCLEPITNQQDEEN